LHVATDVKAWMAGLRRAHVVATVKHWPGHGQASNTHTGAATIPPLSTLEKRDMIPFNAAFAAGVPAVMVGHLMSKGLTEPGWPATLSPHALRYLRAHARPTTLIFTDSLSMAAATSAVHLKTPQAAVRALASGADIALTCSPSGVASAIAKAIVDGRTHVDTDPAKTVIGRAQAVRSARRLMPLKARAGLVRGYTKPFPSTLTASPRSATVAKGGTDDVTGRLTGGYRFVTLQQFSSGAWHTVRTVTSGRLGNFHIAAPTATTGQHRLRVTTPWAYPFATATSKTMTITVTG
jgi:beta-glucosidase-like glycosyl hydrolase